MTQSDTPDRRRSTHRRAWVIGASIAVVVAAAVVLALVQWPRAETPPRTVATPSETPTSSPTAVTACQVSEVEGEWFDGWIVDLPSDGRLSETAITEVAGEYVVPSLVDDDRVAFASSGAADESSSLTVADRRSGAALWQIEFPRNAWVVSTPASSGPGDRIVVASVDPASGGTNLEVRSLADGSVLAWRTFEADWITGVSDDAGLAATATTAPRSADHFWVATPDEAYLLSPDDLETLATVTGEEYGVGQFEGGVPFRLAGDVLFVGGHAADATTGTSLGWQTQSSPLTAAGHVLTTPIVYDSLEPYALTGLDTRTGESCWQHEVISVAADADSLWIVSSAGALQRVDAATGAVTEDRGDVGDSNVELLAGAVVTSPRAPAFDAEVAVTIHAASGARVEFSSDGSVLHSTPTQILSSRQGTIDSVGEVAAIDPASAAVVWTAATGNNGADRVVFGGGVALRTTPLGDGRVRLSLIH